MTLLPQIGGHFERVDVALLPPPMLLAGGVDLVMVDGAKRHGELIAHFQAKSSRLGVADMMSVRGSAPANPEIRSRSLLRRALKTTPRAAQPPRRAFHN